MSYSREERRISNKHKKQRAKRIANYYSLDENFYAKNYNHLKYCSCEACRNPRKSNLNKQKRTIQERRNTGDKYFDLYGE